MNVQIISQQGQAALVEWTDVLGPHRVILPVSEVGAEIPYDQLVGGMPYGVPWETLAVGEGVATRLARELRARGIWTREDLERNMTLARAALVAAYAQDLRILIEGAKEANHE